MTYSHGHVWLISSYNVKPRNKNLEFLHVSVKQTTLWQKCRSSMNSGGAGHSGKATDPWPHSAVGGGCGRGV